MVLNWVSRVIAGYFQIFDIGFWFWWLLHILSCISHPVNVSKPKILAKTCHGQSSKAGGCWLPVTFIFLYIRRMVISSHQTQVFDDCPWPSFLEKKKMMVIGRHQTWVFDDCPWPSFHIYGKTYHDHDFLNFLKILPFFDQNFAVWHLLRVWYTC